MSLRQTFRRLLARPEKVPATCAYDAISAKIV